MGSVRVNEIGPALEPGELCEEERSVRQEVFSAAARLMELRESRRVFVPGETPIPPSGKVLDAADLMSLLDAGMDLWLTTGRYAHEFERRFAARLGLKCAILTNSGSSANLLAVTALTSPLLGDRRLRPGDEVITAAAAFPTTVNPLLQNGLVPVFVDIDIPTYNVSPAALVSAIGPKTKAVILAHTLGNPFDAERISRICREKGLWLIEDSCDALGARFADRPVSTFGDLGTFSFYPAHHITMGEGGAVVTDSPRLAKIVESFRDWGRDCWCPTGKDNTCGKRFAWNIEGLPKGYDHKYIYTHVGYNLKVTDMQAAIGLSQLGKLDGFIRDRRDNFAWLRDALAPHEKYLILPEETVGGAASWFGFCVTVRADAPFDRKLLVAHLEKNKIGTRLLFGGNMTRQPSLAGHAFRTVGSLENSDRVMSSTFWFGLFPGIRHEAREYIKSTFDEFIADYR